MYVLSFDVGIKNLAYCLYEIVDSKWKITHWSVVNMCQENEERICMAIVKNKPCKNIAKYTKNDECYCKTHAKKESSYQILPNGISPKRIKKMKLKELMNLADDIGVEYITPIQKAALLNKIEENIEQKYYDVVQPIRADDVDLITIGRHMKLKFDILFNEFVSKLDYVIIENQISPIANRMKTIQGMLAQYFIMKSDAKIEFVSSVNKLKNFQTKKMTYGDRKKLGVTKTMELIEDASVNETINFSEIFKNSKKKDDLADCFLQGYWYIYEHLLIK